MNVTEKQQLLFHLHFVLVANGILIYDHMLTLPEEIRFIWCRPKIRSSIFFLVNRYFALVSNIFGLCIDFLPAVPDESCSTYMLVRELLLFLQQIAVCFTLTLRIHALYGRNRRFLSCMILFGLALGAGVAASCFGDNNTTTYIQGSDCHNTFTTVASYRYGVAWVAVFLYELLIFILIIFRTWKTRRCLRLSLFDRKIPDIIFQDGAMYFGAMTLINLPNILTYYCGSDITRGNLATFTSCMSVTLISRLVLNLHKTTDNGIFSTAIRDNDLGLDVLTTRINVQAVISS